MSAVVILSIIVLYFILLWVISYYTSKKANNDTFFNANKDSPWHLVAFGMIGGSLSAVTFMSVPGWVEATQFSYMQTVMGYFFGYLVITHVLLPLYYRLNLTSIYTYLENRFGVRAYKMGAISFLVSRMIGSSMRMYLVLIALDNLLFKPIGWNVPFGLTALITVGLVWVYTYKGGIKTIIWTDTLQTTFMLLSVIITLIFIAKNMGGSFLDLATQVKESSYSQIFFWDDVNAETFFWKNFLGGMFITIAMTGLDQDMMQKNISCKSLPEAQKNMFWFSLVLIGVNFLFLFLGASLFLYAQQVGFAIPEKTDLLFSSLAFSSYFPPIVAVFFAIGLISIAYSSSDSSLTSMTTALCYDILGVRGNTDADIQTRKKMHLLISFISVLVIVGFKELNNESVIKELFKMAGYTYGALLGLFTYGLVSKKRVNDAWIPVIFILSPLLCYILNAYSMEWFNGYKIGFELLLINALITIVYLQIISNLKRM